MASVTVSGTLPSVILENSTASSWVGNLALAGSVSSIRTVTLKGSGASYFLATLDAAHGLVHLTPAARIDYEMFALTGLTPALDFQLVFTFSDNTTQTDPTNRHIVVQNIDDTPPSALAFTTGGSATAGSLGAVIGTLKVTDVETAGPFYFSFADSDAWKYEVVGSTLKLKDGYSYGLDDVGTIKLPIQVSDGVQSAAFTMTITVNAPGAQPDLMDYLVPGQLKANFWYINATTVSGMHVISDVGYVNTYAGGVHGLMLNDGSAVWLPNYVAEVQFADGLLDLRRTGSAAMAYELYHTILHRDPDPVGYSYITNLLESGSMSLLGLTEALLQSPEYTSRIGNPTNATFLNALYQDALGRAADPGGYSYQLGRLNAGTSRAQMVDDFIMSQEAQNQLAARHPDGFFVTSLYGKEVTMVYEVALGREPDPGGLTYWQQQLQAGTLSPSAMAGLIGGSQEYLNRYAGLNDAAFITAMYSNALHRAPDPGGYAAWTQLLANHTYTRTDMVNAFAFSPENYNNFAAHPGGLDLFYF